MNHWINSHDSATVSLSADAIIDDACCIAADFVADAIYTNSEHVPSKRFSAYRKNSKNKMKKKAE